MTKLLSCAEVMLVLVSAGVTLHPDLHIGILFYSNVFAGNELR